MIPRLHRLLALAAFAAATSHAAELGADVETLLATARAQNPELALMRAEAEAARQRIQPAQALPDPVLRVERMNFASADEMVRPETRYTLMQMLPAWGKRDIKREAAEADERQAVARTDAAWAELAMRVKTAFARYYMAAGSERITREVLELMARVEQVAQVRYAGGLVPQQDAIRAQLEQTTMRTELVAMESEKRQARARINALLARAPGAPLAEPAQLRPLPAGPALDVAALTARAQANSPVVRAEVARLQAAEKGRELAFRNRWPDFNVGVSPTQARSRVMSWGVMVEMNIPLQQDARRSAEAEAGAMVRAARARIDNAGAQIAGDLGENVAALEAARRTAEIAAAQALPQSELSLRSALAAYENGKLEFTALLEAQRQIRKVRQDRLKAEADARMRLAEIERLVGEDL